MLFKKIFISVVLSFLFFSFAISQEILIVSKVNNEIITNIDIENEKKYPVEKSKGIAKKYNKL